MELRGQNGGWLELAGVDGIEGKLYMRLKQDARGTWKVRELYLCSDVPITPGTTKAIPVDIVELVVNEDDYLMLKHEVPGPDLERLAAYGSTTWGNQADNWIKDSWLAQIPGSGVPQPKMPKRRPPRDQPKRAPLVAPDRLDDEFLERVADAYVDVVSQRLNPAPVLANEAQVSPRTVHRWILQARKRGFLPEGTQGRAGV